jgi:hypothetical protein
LSLHHCLLRLLLLLQTVEGNVSVIFAAEELEEALAKNPDKLVVLFCGLTWCRWGSCTMLYASCADSSGSCKDAREMCHLQQAPAFAYQPPLRFTSCR